MQNKIERTRARLERVIVMAHVHIERLANNVVRIPEWLYYFTDEQFILWCKQRKVQLCTESRSFPEDERAAIFRYMVRQNLVN